MASPFSILKRRTEFANPYNADLFGEVVSQKQNILTQNEQMLTEAIGNVASVDLLREKDKQYLLNNLQGVIDTVNNTDKIDFTNQSQGTRLSSFIRTSIDGEVQKQAANTAKFRGFQKQIATIKEKKPAQYNDVNYQDAIKMSGFDQYMQGTKDDYSTISYTPYTNVEENVVKRIKTLKDIMPDQDIEVVLPNGLIAKKKKSALTSSEWEGVILNSMTSQEKNQLSIESRAAYNYNDLAARGDYQKQRTNLEEPYDDRILELENESIGTSGTKLKNIENEIANIRASKTRTLAQLDVSNKDAGTIGAQIKMVNLAKKYSKGLGFEITTGYDYSNLNYLIKVNTQERDIAKFKKEQTLLDLEIAEKRGEVNQADPNNPSAAFGGFTTEALPTETEEEKENFKDNIFGGQKRQAVSELNAVATEVFELLKTLPYTGTLKNKGFKTEADAILAQQRKIRGEGKNLTDFEEKAALATFATQHHMLPADMLAKMNRVFEKAKTLENIEVNAKSGAFEQVVANKALPFYNEMVVERGGENQIAYFYGNGKEGKFADVLRGLRADGVNNAEDFAEFIKGDTFKAREIKANIALQAGGNVDLSIQSRASSTTGSVLVPSLIQNPDYKKTFGEQANKFFGKNYEKVLSRVLDETNNVFSYQDGRSFQTNDDFLSKDLANMFSVKDFEREETALLGERTATIAGLNQVTIATGKIKSGQALNPLHIAVSELLGNTDFKTNEPYTATVSEEGVVIRQGGSTTDATSENGVQGVRIKQKLTEEIISFDQLQQRPNLAKLFDTKNSISEVNLNQGVDMEMENISYTDYKRDGYVEGFNNLFGKYGEAEVDRLAGMATPTAAYNHIIRENNSSLRRLSPEKQAFAMRGISNMIDNISNFKVAAKGKGKNATLSISIKGTSGKEIEIQNQRFDVKNEKLMDILAGAPEIYITNVLNDAFNEYVSDLYNDDPNNQNPENIIPSNPKSMMVLMSQSFNQ